MALIKCPECGETISDKATVCPHCGCPIGNADNKQKPTSPEERGEIPSETKPNATKKKGKAKIWIFIVILICLIAGGAYFVFNHLITNGSNNKDAVVELTPEFITAIGKYDKLGAFSEGMAAVKKNGKWGYINIKGEEVIPCQYPNPYEDYTAPSFHEGLAAVQKNGKWGYINAKGEEVIPYNITAEFAGDFSEGLAFIYKDNDSFAVIDSKGNAVFNGESDFSWLYGTDIVPEVLPYYTGGKLYVPTTFDKFAVYDAKGNKVSDKSIGEKSKADKPMGGMQYKLSYKENGDANGIQWTTFGLKDRNGKDVVPAIYDDIKNQELNDSVAVSNGVVLVVLKEIGEDATADEIGGFYSENSKEHYGYADLNGHDTFTQELKTRCEQSKSRAAEIIAQQRIEEERQAEEARQRESDRSITLSADISDGAYLKGHMHSSTGRYYYSVGFLGASGGKVPEGKAIIFKSVDLHSDDNIPFDNVNVNVFDERGSKISSVEARTSGEFTIRAGYTYNVEFRVRDGSFSGHVEAVFHFEEIDE